MSATSSIAVVSALGGLAKALQPLASSMLVIAAKSAATMGTATARALLSLSDDFTTPLAELPSPVRAIAEVARHEKQMAAALRQRGELSKLDIEKTAVVAGVLRAPLVADNMERLQAALAGVEASKTQRDLAAARTELHQVVAAEHGSAWLASLKEITQGAYEKIGFRALQTEALSPREIRMSAINDDGKVLVSELRLAPDGSPSMATEVVNGCGAECDGILAKFETALAEHVRGVAPVRKPTGGVCQLDAAVAFVKRRIRRAPLTTASISSVPRSRQKRVVVQKRS